MAVYTLRDVSCQVGISDYSTQDIEGMYAGCYIVSRGALEYSEEGDKHHRVIDALPLEAGYGVQEQLAGGVSSSTQSQVAY